MRIRLSEKSLELLFNTLNQSGWFDNKIAKHLGVSERTIRDWRAGRTTMLSSSYVRMRESASLGDEDLKPEYLKSYWYTHNAGHLGAESRMKLYGNPGTLIGRKKGGKNSLKSHARLQTKFKLLRKIKSVDKTEKLAELMGVIFGDGHVAEFQVSVTTNSETDLEHAVFVQKLFKEIFKVQASLTKKKGCNAVNVVVSSKDLTRRLCKFGMLEGNKIKNNITVPSWILSKLSFQKAFIRGLFDTDGCIYLDNHKGKNKIYKYLGWTITSYASRLRDDIMRILVNLGFRPVHKESQCSVYLHRNEEIKKYFSIIGTHNPKHLMRYKKFIGEVA